MVVQVGSHGNKEEVYRSWVEQPGGILGFNSVSQHLMFDVWEVPKTSIPI